MPTTQALLEFINHHLLLSGALVASLLALVLNEIYSSLTGGAKLGAPQAVRLINDRDAKIIDLRSVADFKKGHLLGAVNIPHDKLKDRLAELDKDKSRPMLLVCAMGGTSRESALQLKKLGYAEPYPLAGGLNAWLAASLPVTVK